MKICIIFIGLIFFYLRGIGQCPDNEENHYKDDHNWQEVWGDVFNYHGKPNPAKWKMNYWGMGPSYDSFRIYTENGYNAKVNDSFLSLIARSGVYHQQFSKMVGNTKYTYTVTRSYTSGLVSTQKRDFRYGFFEAKIRMPDNYYTDLYGKYWDNGFWLYNVGYNIDWNELDFEIVSNGAHGELTNTMECNMHAEIPAGANKRFTNLTGDANPYHDPSHFANLRIDPSSDHAGYIHRYESNNLIFGHGWHIFSYEWLPGQIKFYLDHKLWFRLENDYVYNYIDMDFIHQSTRPVDNLSLGMPLLLNFCPQSSDPYKCRCGPDSLSMDIKYVKYYQLITNCGNDFIQTGSPPYELCNHYLQQVYDRVYFGDYTGTCSTCSVTVNGACRESVRAKDITLYDGFHVGEGEFYACDVHVCP
jgi:hypothetical protein